MDGFIIPSSIQRVRSFLIEMYGMKVKPWANTEETLAALHTMLVARQHCDRFWVSLRGLLQQLACDLKKRQSALPGTLVDNELLESQRFEALLCEIRDCLAKQKNESTTGSFRRLASGLSAPALGLLLLLGGAATAGCDHAALGTGSRTPDAAISPADARDARPDTQPDSMGIILPPPPDVPPRVAPDVAPAWDAVTAGTDGAVVTIQDIMDSCNIDDRDQVAVLLCLRSLRASWSTGIAQELAGKSCATVTSRLRSFECSSSWEPCQPYPAAASQDFTEGDAPYCPPVLIYMGVRFV